MVAVMEVSEDMADKTRKALAEAAPYVSTPVFVEVAQFFDRLSPPAPEVDEATVWTRKAMDAIYPFGQTGLKGNSPIARLTEVISELIASKDAEIAHWYHLAVGDAEGVERADAELAVLRAEIERLKGANELRQSARELRDNPNGSCSAIMQAIHLEERAAKLEAAERNPAEQCDKGFDQGSRRPADTAPVVEVTASSLRSSPCWTPS